MLHAVCGLSGVIHSYDLSKASVHDLNYMKDVKLEYHARKRIETIFSQLSGQFLVIRNYAKIINGLFARIIGKISALTVFQHVNYINNKPIGRIKYALN